MHKTLRAQSGAGKTITFALGILTRLIDISKAGATQALVVSPTRELAQQTSKVIAALGDYMGVTVHTSVGKSNYTEDIQKCQQGFHVICGTPGRMNDMLSKGYINGSEMRIVVFDEADVLLEQGFREDVERIWRSVKESQTVCVSATFPHDILEMTFKFMKNTVNILKMRDEIAVESINNYFITMECEEWKFDTLCDLFDTIEVIFFYNLNNDPIVKFVLPKSISYDD